MRAVPLLLLLVAGPALAETPKTPRAGTAAKPAGASTIACASLANYRILMRETRDAAGAAAVLADPRADHLGCAVTARESVTGIGDHIALDGRSYECLSLQSTSVCQWTEAGSISPPAAKPPRAPAQKAPVDPAKAKR